MKKWFNGFVSGVIISVILISSVTVHAMGGISKTIDVVLNNVNLSFDGDVVAEQGVNYKLDNGEEVPFSIVYNGTTYLPIRKVAELFGKAIGWDGDTNTISVGEDVVEAATEEAEEYEIENIMYNGELISLDGKPIIKGDIILMPIRDIVEMLDLEMIWNGKLKQMTMTSAKTNKCFVMTVDSDVCVFNDENYILDSKVEVINNRTFIPIRFIVESLGGSVAIDSAITTVIVDLLEMTNDDHVNDNFPIEYLEEDKEYLAKDGLTVVLDSIKKTETAGAYEYKISYTLTNNTDDQKIDEGAFKIYYDDGTYENQYGFFGSLYPTESIMRTYTFKMLKTLTPIAIEYGSDFFDDKIGEETLVWKAE